MAAENPSCLTKLKYVIGRNFNSKHRMNDDVIPLHFSGCSVKSATSLVFFFFFPDRSNLLIVDLFKIYMSFMNQTVHVNFAGCCLLCCITSVVVCNPCIRV